jgi:hypothetical protein
MEHHVQCEVNLNDVMGKHVLSMVYLISGACQIAFSAKAASAEKIVKLWCNILKGLFLYAFINNR